MEKRLTSAPLTPAPKVELHLHLDGAIRPSTVWDLAKKRVINVPGNTAEEMAQAIRGFERGNLSKFLETFSIFLPPIVGDNDAIRRLAYEVCEDKAREGVIYFEARFCPQLLVSEALTVHDVMRSVSDGIVAGQRDFNVKARLIMTTPREKPSWAAECLQLCREYRSLVVGLDMADCGQESDSPGQQSSTPHATIVSIFQEAARCGIHRTVHAGEDEPAIAVKNAIELLKAERIGHGYHVLGDESIYQLAKDKGVHFEVCPSSSVSTGSCDPDFTKHPCVRFMKDNISLSLNTDDPTVLGNTINDEFAIASNYFGMTKEQEVQVTMNTAQATFLPEQEKLELIQTLRAAYNIPT